MNRKEVKVFNAYVEVKNEKYYRDLGLSSTDLFDYHNQIVRKDGTVKPNSDAKWKKLKPMKPLPEDIETKFKYELDSDEKMTLSMLKSSTKNAKDLYNSCKRKESKYYDMLEHKFLDNYGNEFDQIFYGDKWDCHLSPFGYCLYHYDGGGEPTCIFCGEPEERK